MVRYFETAEEDDTAAKPKTVVCKKCGAEGEHRTYECPVIIVSMSVVSAGLSFTSSHGGYSV